MAKVQNPLHSSEARGAVGGLIYNTTRGVRYVKTNTSPSQPRTTAQTTVRTLLTTISREWKALTSGQIDAWKTYASNNPVSDWTGSQIRMTGANAYSKLNFRARHAGGSQITSPPTAVAPSPPAALTATYASSELRATWTSTLGSGIKLDAWVLGPVSAGVDGRIEQATHEVYSAANASSPLTIIASPATGTYKVWLRVVDTATGLVSGWTKVTVTVT